LYDKKQSPLSDPSGAERDNPPGAVASDSSPSNLSDSQCPTLDERPAPLASEETTLDIGPAPPADLSAASRPFFEAARGLGPGKIIAGRYEILKVLGEGGMGTVYKANDRELNRVIALKTIRPRLAHDLDIIQRFKQELILARQVTHRNVVRIYDLGEADGIKFITMEYIDGEPLIEVLKRRGKLPPKEAVEIIEKVCVALEAAHAEGVVHRDLKLGNIMQDRQGRVVVMDFGLAHSVELRHTEVEALESLSGDSSAAAAYLSMPGSLIGTPRYMSPEQVKMEEVDGRSDLYTLGLILYELITGQTPFPAQYTIENLLKRAQENPRPLVEVDPQVPRALSNIVAKCLERDREARYQTVEALLNDLERWRKPVTRKVGTWIAVGAAVLLLAGVQFLIQRKATDIQHAPVSVLVADFKNETRDPVFDGTLEPALGTALEGASFITGYNRAQAHKIAAQLQPGMRTLDEPLARLVATREGINEVVSGSISKPGDMYVVQVKTLDPLTGKVLFTSESKSEKKNVLLTVAALTARVRKTLGDTTPESEQMAAAETFTTGSLEAAREYADAQSSLWAGKMDDATQHYLKAVQLDPNMGRAYTGLAVVYLNNKQPQEAKKYFELALSKIDRMSDREKFRTRGVYYAFLGNTEKAIEELTQLVQQYPSDSAGMANLALSYFFRRDMKRALETGRRAVEINPKNVIQRNNVGLYAMYAGDFDAAIREQQVVLQMNPSFGLAYVGTALPQLGQGQNTQAEQTYHRLEQLGPQAASQGAMGLADLALYEGRAGDAIQILDKGIAADLKLKDLDGAASKYVTLGEADLLEGKTSLARAAADKAVASSNDLGVSFRAARIYLAVGENTKSLDVARKLAAKLEPDPQAYAKLIEGEVQLQAGKPRDAIALFEESRKIADTWMGRFDAARAYLDAGAYAEVDSEIEVCLKRRGEATALFLDESPTYHLFPPVYYYLGRAQEGLKSPAAKESYQTFLSMQPNGASPLLADARHRLASH
jgi:tetratricopeptide (TPR) repeat protein/predicted Ser/Thr protein kinase